MILGVCIGIIILGIVIFIVYIKRMLSGRCCEGCSGCNQKYNCSNYKPNIDEKNIMSKKIKKEGKKNNV